MAEGGCHNDHNPGGLDDLEDDLKDLQRAVVKDGIWWVELHGQMYSFENLPSPDSALVKICVNNFQENGLSDIGRLDEPFMEVCCQLELGLYGAVANGMGKLETMIEEVCFDMNELCKKIGTALVSFSCTSKDACIHYKTVFLYLLEGLEDIAHLKLKTLSKSVSSLAASAELKRLVDRCNGNVKKLLEWVADEKAKLGKAGEERKTWETGMLMAKRDHGDVEERFATENQMVARMEKGHRIRERVEVGVEALAAMAQVAQFALPVPMKVGATTITVTVVNAVQRFIKSTDGTKDKIQLAKRRVADLEKEQLEAKKRMNAHADELERAREREEVLNGLQPLLHNLSRSLKIVRNKLSCACSFWERLETVVAPEIDAQQLHANVNALPVSKEERAEFWRSKAFAEDAISMYARWVARGIVCDQSRVGIRGADKMLDQLSFANPTQDQARDWLKHKVEKGQAIE